MPRPFSPFDPDGARARPGRPLPQVPVRLILPNLVTLVALCSGLTAIRFAIEGRFEYAVYAVLFAAALDGIDGRVARLLRGTSRFGGQLDSLADFVDFGVAPAVILYIWSLSDIDSVGWLASLLFAICCAMRLARFNLSLDGPPKVGWRTAYFVGVPAPAGAVLALFPIYLEFLGAPHGFWTAPVVMIYLILIAVLMISQLPTWSGKLIGRRIPRDQVPMIFIGFVVFTGLLVSFPFLVLTIGTIIYLGALPLTWRTFHDRKALEAVREQAAARAAPAAPTPPTAPEPLRLEPPATNGGSPRRERRVRKSSP